jgi:hypothetical protein
VRGSILVGAVVPIILSWGVFYLICPFLPRQALSSRYGNITVLVIPIMEPLHELRWYVRGLESRMDPTPKLVRTQVGAGAEHAGVHESL